MTAQAIGAMAFAACIAFAMLAPWGTFPLPSLALRHPDRTALADAGWTRSVREWELLRAAALAAALVVASSLGAAPLGVLGALGPSLAVRVIASRRRDRLHRDALATVRLVHAAMRSGSAIPEAIRIATRGDTGAPEAFAIALREFELGAPLDAALASARRHVRERGMRTAFDALALCVGEALPLSRCAALLEAVLDRMAYERRLAADVRARTSGLRSQIWLLAALVPGLSLYLTPTMPGLGETLASPLGRFVLIPSACALEVIGIVASRRVVRGIA